MRRKISDLGSSPPSGRLRLTILLATVAAFMLVPAAQAFAEGGLTVHVAGTGSGEVSSVGGASGFKSEELEFLKAFGNAWEGEPPIECSGPPATGLCETEMVEEEALPGISGIALHAEADPGSEFVGSIEEEGECAFTAAPDCFITGNGGEASITYVFDAIPTGGPKLTLNIEEGSGTVVSNPAGLECTGSAPHSCETESIAEGSVTLTASPAAGYAFKSWKGCGTVNGRQCTVSLTEAKTVGAKFYKTWSLTGTKSNPNGIFSTAPGGVNCGYGCISSSAAYKEGALTLKAKPAKNFHFVKYTNGTGSAASCNEVTTETCAIAAFNSDSAIEEVYAENAKHTLTFSKEGGGQGFVKTKPTNINCGYTCTAASAEFFSSEEVPVTVTLNKGTTQVTWTTGAGTCTGNALSCAVPMSASHTLVAKFE